MLASSAGVVMSSMKVMLTKHEKVTCDMAMIQATSTEHLFEVLKVYHFYKNCLERERERCS